MNLKQQVGKEGEELATRYLRKKGYKIYRRNVRLSRDEIDIIAFDPSDKAIVFVEVKARSKKHRDYTPQLNMPRKKHQHVLRAARRWIARKQYDKGYRIDLVAVAGGRVTGHFKEVNYWHS